jgi:hypothetical protein
MVGMVRYLWSKSDSFISDSDGDGRSGNSERQENSSYLSSGMYWRVNNWSTDVSEVRAASIIRAP